MQSNGIIPASSAKVELHLEAQKNQATQNQPESYPNLPPRFLPKEGYELIGALVKVDPTLTKYLLKFLKGAELVPDENSPTGYREQQIKGANPFCNDDGVDKITDLILIHINTPMSYKEGYKSNPQPPSQIAGNIAKQFIKDVAANYERWEIKNPSLIPQLAAIIFDYIKAAQGQQTELPEGLLNGGALRPKSENNENSKRPAHGRLSL